MKVTGLYNSYPVCQWLRTSQISRLDSLLLQCEECLDQSTNDQLSLIGKLSRFFFCELVHRCRKLGLSSRRLLLRSVYGKLFCYLLGNVDILFIYNSVSPSYFYYGAAPCPFSPASCPFSQRHALFLNIHIMPYILVKNHQNLTKTKEVIDFLV